MPIKFVEQSQTITSLEVAEMVGKRHDHLIRDIKKYIGELSRPNFGETENFSEGKISYVEFFKESSYVDAQGKERLCYDVTKKGCEFIAHKLTGEKGTQFTARYINRFHDMEEYIKGNSGLLVTFKEQVQSLETVADMLRMNEASKLLMLENFYKQYNIPTEFLPKYEHNGNRKMKALSVLLKENNCKMSAVKLNLILIEQGYLEERERASSKGGTKKFKALTERGLQYGENAVNPHNQKEVQPLYYSNTFLELYKKVTG